MDDISSAHPPPAADAAIKPAQASAPVPAPEPRFPDACAAGAGRRAASAGLENDIRLLEGVLDSTILRIEGAEALRLVEEIRASSQELRATPSPAAARRLADRLQGLGLPELRTLTRVFSLYFDLINLAEQHARVRALRERAQQLGSQPLPETPELALLQLRERGFTGPEAAEALRRARIQPVFTAHPSEARRRTVLEKLDAISSQLDRLELVRLLPRERAEAIDAIAVEVETFWLTDIVRAERPTALDEVRHGLGLVAPTLFEIVPRLYRSLGEAMARVYPEEREVMPSLLRFGSWIGGDRDGNPNVTPEVTREAVHLHQQTILRHYLEQIDELGRKLSHSQNFLRPGPELLQSVAADRRSLPGPADAGGREVYRIRCRAIAARLGRTLDRSQGHPAERPELQPPPDGGIYRHPSELRADLESITRDLESSRCSPSTAGLVRDLTRQVEVFGLHFLTLDVRQHAARHTRALDEIFRWAGVCDRYARLAPTERFDLLSRELSQRRPLFPAHLPFSAETREAAQLFRSIAAILEQQCGEAVENYIISGVQEPSNLLEALLLAREAGLFNPAEGISRLHVVPLLESLDSLTSAVPLIQKVLSQPVYRQHLQLRGNIQEVMLGYSDSSKESGFLQSSWSIYKANRQLGELSQRTGIALPIFHGRGGAIGRGGGPANQAILAQPHGAMNGGIRITEQGEVIADRYGRPAIAWRHLDQILHAVLLTSVPEEERLDPAWDWAMERLAASACRHYRSLVYETPGFIRYFEQATPFSEISRLKIASRPTFRSAARAIHDLRAIPWVFSWMQNRHTLPGWYGLGSAAADFVRDHGGELAQLQSMYRSWPFWRTLIDNTQMILAKADMTISRLYADLVDDAALAERIFGRIESEHRATVDVVLKITGQARLLDNVPVLQSSIERRNPHVDPLSFIQLVLLRRLRSGEPNSEELETACLESINGIASGLKNTG